jgi:hypothetical protein
VLFRSTANLPNVRYLHEVDLFRHESAMLIPRVPHDRNAVAPLLDIFRHATNMNCRGSKNPSVLHIALELRGDPI